MANNGAIVVGVVVIGVIAGLAEIRKHHNSDKNMKDLNNDQTKGQNKSSKEYNSSENTSPPKILFDELKSGVNRIPDQMKKDLHQKIEEIEKNSGGFFTEATTAHFQTLLGEVKKDMDKLSDSIENIKSIATGDKSKSRKDDPVKGK